MKAVRFHEFGDASVLRYEDAPEPGPGPGQVLVRLKAASLNHLDVWVRSGRRERNAPFPHIPGSDGAGVVERCGVGVSSVKPGDPVLISPGLSCGKCAHCAAGKDNLCREYRVLGVRESGTCAQFVAVPSENVLPVPEGLSYNEAAAVPLVSLTAWHMLVTLARLGAGETVLVHGAGSGIGSIAIQIGKLLGARVITTAGSDEKLARAKDLGADELVNYRSTDFVEEVKRLTDRRGVDVVFEHVGGEVFEKSITVLGRGGRLVTCGATTEHLVKLDVRYVYSRHQAIFGSWMSGKPELVEVLRHYGGKSPKLRPVIDSVFPLEKAADAHRRMESRKNFGKIVLEIP